jgi:hypothetical protein
MAQKNNSSLFGAFLSALNLGKFVYFPSTVWEPLFKPQLSLFNIFAGNPEDTAVEEEVLHRVGSYGSQLSTLLAAVEMLCDRVPPETQSALEARTVQKLKRLNRESKEAVALYKGEFNSNDADRFLDYLAKIKEKNPPLFAALARRLGVITKGEVNGIFRQAVGGSMGLKHPTGKP